jgi:hypothetical protein
VARLRQCVYAAGAGTSEVLVITPTRGLIDERTRIRIDDLPELAEVDIHQNDCSLFALGYIATPGSPGRARFSLVKTLLKASVRWLL